MLAQPLTWQWVWWCLRSEPEHNGGPADAALQRAAPRLHQQVRPRGRGPLEGAHALALQPPPWARLPDTACPRVLCSRAIGPDAVLAGRDAHVGRGVVSKVFTLVQSLAWNGSSPAGWLRAPAGDWADAREAARELRAGAAAPGAGGRAQGPRRPGGHEGLPL